MNKEIRALEDQILNDLNAAADVPMEAKRLILTDVLNIVTKAADEIILQELSEDKHE